MTTLRLARELSHSPGKQRCNVMYNTTNNLYLQIIIKARIKPNFKLQMRQYMGSLVEGGGGVVD